LGGAPFALPPSGYRATVPTRAQVLSLLGRGRDIETAARELGVPAGLAFMIATGKAADGSEVSAHGERGAVPGLPAAPQLLVNPPEHNPLYEGVSGWVRERAARDLSAGV
jgi:hypothetical protein